MGVHVLSTLKKALLFYPHADFWDDAGFLVVQMLTITNMHLNPIFFYLQPKLGKTFKTHSKALLDVNNDCVLVVVC